MISATSISIFMLIISAVNAESSVNSEDILYEVGPDGNVTIDYFGEPPIRMNLVPVIGELNPSPRLPSCEHLGTGLHPVFGNCSQYLECELVQHYGKFGIIRRIVQCPRGLWFRQDLNECGPQDSDECPLGRLIPNPVVFTPIISTLRSGGADSGGGPCVRSGLFTLPGCRGYYTCIATYVPGVFHRFTYGCSAGYKYEWSLGSCKPEQHVICHVPEVDTECTRDCIAGAVRVCRFTFIVEEFASMSIYCKNCPFTASDCDLPNCVPGGGISKPLVTINRQVPGPAIQVCKDDILEIEVQNRLSADSTTIHWHGIHQRETPYMDGVPFITQCPILPGNTFRYRMKADVSGTHLYHSHVGHQESDGMFGPMIIREPRLGEHGISDRYDMDLPEHRVLMWHWFSRTGDTESIDTRLQSLRREGFGYLINGKGSVTKIYGDKGEPVPLPMETYYLKTGFRYRFRAIFNSALNCPVQVSIDGHVLDVIATDGRPVTNTLKYVDSIFMSAGERVDFVPHHQAGVRTKKQSFFLRVRGLNDCDDRKNGVFQTAILRYDESRTTPTTPPLTYANAIRSGVGFNLNLNLSSTNNYHIEASSLMSKKNANPNIEATISGAPARTFYINAGFNGYTISESTNVTLPQLNDISWRNPSFPPLTQPEDVVNSTFCRPGEQRNCENGLCQCSHILEANRGELVELVIVDSAGFGIGHPFHLHGYVFHVVAMYQGLDTITVQQVKAQNEARKIQKRYDGPIKDTVIVPGRGYVILRFVADNPGYWLFHCHISEHMAQGMALVLKVGKHSQMVKAPTNFPRCGNFFGARTLL